MTDDALIALARELHAIKRQVDQLDRRMAVMLVERGLGVPVALPKMKSSP